MFSPEAALLSAYIFSWQFPHFYGILYANKQDYSNANFVMISNEDPEGKVASKHIFACHALSFVIPVGMAMNGMI